MLQSIFFKLCSAYTRDQKFIEAGWQEILNCYNSPGRYYHNLHHLEQMTAELQPVLPSLVNADACMFAVFYHDLIYEPLKTDNESRSALFAVERMKALGMEEQTIVACAEMIKATEGHLPGTTEDVNYFTDADLSILGKNRNVYENYSALIRKEFAFLSDAVYSAGRIRVMEHFLKMESIFKTRYFFLKYEARARLNIGMELEKLNKEY